MPRKPGVPGPHIENHCTILLSYFKLLQPVLKKKCLTHSSTHTHTHTHTRAHTHTRTHTLQQLIYIHNLGLPCNFHQQFKHTLLLYFSLLHPAWWLTTSDSSNTKSIVVVRGEGDSLALFCFFCVHHNRCCSNVSIQYDLTYSCPICILTLKAQSALMWSSADYDHRVRDGKMANAFKWFEEDITLSNLTWSMYLYCCQEADQYLWPWEFLKRVWLSHGLCLPYWWYLFL